MQVFPLATSISSNVLGCALHALKGTSGKAPAGTDGNVGFATIATLMRSMIAEMSGANDLKRYETSAWPLCLDCANLSIQFDLPEERLEHPQMHTVPQTSWCYHMPVLCCQHPSRRSDVRRYTGTSDVCLLCVLWTRCLNIDVLRTEIRAYILL